MKDTDSSMFRILKFKLDGLDDIMDYTLIEKMPHGKLRLGQ